MVCQDCGSVFFLLLSSISSSPSLHNTECNKLFFNESTKIKRSFQLTDFLFGFVVALFIALIRKGNCIGEKEKTTEKQGTREEKRKL
jgi:hypothetical protein